MIIVDTNGSDQVFEYLKEDQSFSKKSHKHPAGDYEVWQKFRQGKESAFIYIYDTYFNPLYSYSQKFTRDKSLIKDCIQDMFMDIRKNRQNLSPTDSIKLYLFKSIKRRIIRAEQRHKQLYSGDELQECGHFHFVLSHEHYLINKQLSEEKINCLQAAVNDLPDRQKEIIYYLFYENMGYNEIRELMNFSDAKAARNLAYRAFKSLRSTLMHL